MHLAPPDQRPPYRHRHSFRRSGLRLWHRVVDHRPARAWFWRHRPTLPEALERRGRSVDQYRPGVQRRRAVAHGPAASSEHGCPSNSRSERFESWRSCDYIVITSGGSPSKRRGAARAQHQPPTGATRVGRHPVLHTQLTGQVVEVRRRNIDRGVCF